jgi:hypothetical protein
MNNLKVEDGEVEHQPKAGRIQWFKAVLGYVHGILIGLFRILDYF